MCCIATPTGFKLLKGCSISAMNYVQLAIPYFILAIILESIYGYLRKNQTYRLNDTVNSLQMGMLSRLVGVLRLGFSAVVFTHLVSLFGVQQWSADTWVHWVLAFIAYDCCYYWKHRFGHQWRIMWASHSAHHQSEEYNLSTALRQTGTDYIGFVFYIPMYLAGTPVEVMVTVGSLNLVYQFWVHTEHVRFLGVLDYILVTPSNHRVHHAKNPGYIDKNFGGVFVIWDRLFGTFAVERVEEPCRFGITHGLKSWNPVWANAIVWWDTVKLSMQTRRWQDKFLLWFKGPAWLPEDISQTHAGSWQDDKFDPVASTYCKIYVFAQFVVVTLLALVLQELQNELPTSFVLVAFFFLVLSVCVQGVWLEARGPFRVMEAARLTAVGVLSLILPTAWPAVEWTVQPYELSLLLQSYIAVSGVLLLGSFGRIAQVSEPAAEQAGDNASV